MSVLRSKTESDRATPAERWKHPQEAELNPSTMEDRKRGRGLLLTLLLLSSPWLFVQGWILVAADDPGHTSMPACPASTANCAYLSTESTVRMDTELTAVIDANVSEVWQAWVDWSEENNLRPGHTELGEGGERFAHGVAITPFWRFPDDVVVLFQPQDDTTAITLYSASRIGVSDLGVNPDRLESLHRALVAVQDNS